MVFCKDKDSDCCVVFGTVCSCGENKKKKIYSGLDTLFIIYLLTTPHSLWDLTDLAKNFIHLFPQHHVQVPKENFGKLNSSLIMNWIQALGKESMPSSPPDHLGIPSGLDSIELFLNSSFVNLWAMSLKTNYLTSSRINSFICQMIVAYSFVVRWNAMFLKIVQCKKKSKINIHTIAKSMVGSTRNQEDKFLVLGLQKLVGKRKTRSTIFTCC